MLAYLQVSIQSELGADPCKEVKYKETSVDAMRLQKDEVCIYRGTSVDTMRFKKGIWQMVLRHSGYDRY